MNSTKFDSCKLHGSLISNGHLMSPGEVQEAIHHRQGVPGLLPGWCLCGDTTASMFDAIIKHGNGVDVRLSGFAGPANGAYATITQQVGGMQHRFLLPLFEPPVIAFLKALEQQPVQVMLGREGGGEALMLHNALPLRSILPLVGMCQPSRRVGVNATHEEMIDALDAVSRPETIPSVYKGIDVTGMSVSVIVPVTYCLSVGKDKTVERGTQ
ncbi:conserved protein of unknown function [Burkholderia multivorans]